ARQRSPRYDKVARLRRTASPQKGVSARCRRAGPLETCVACRIGSMGRLYARDVHGPTRPWWQEEAPPDEELPPLADDVDAEVAIIGGGFTGLWTALELKRTNPATGVVLVESARCG